MSPKRVIERNAGAFIGPGVQVPAPVNADNVGPGKPGPGDEWIMPEAPIDTTAGQEGATDQPAESDATEVPPAPRRG